MTALLWVINVIEVIGAAAGIASAAVLWKVYQDQRFRALYAALTREKQHDQQPEESV